MLCVARGSCCNNYSCCNNLLGILLHHSSRTAATRGNKSHGADIRRPPLHEPQPAMCPTSAIIRRVEGRLDLHIQASDCDIDILHGLRQRVAATEN